MAQNDSGIASSDDMTPKSKKMKLEDDESGSGYPEQNDCSAGRMNTTTMKRTEKRKIRVKLFKKDDRYDRFETDGKESIVSMVERLIEERCDGKKKPRIENLLFKSDSSGYHLNLGRPTGTLSEKEYYVCTYNNNGKRFTDMIRDYDVEVFDESWNLSSFNVKFEKNEHFFVSDMQRIIDGVRVDFFPGETLFEALFLDGRFTYTDKVRQSDFVAEDGSIVFLSSEATSDNFKLTKRNSQNPKLPAEVRKQRKPSCNVVPVKQEHSTPSGLIYGPNTGTPFATHSTPISKQQVEKLPEYSTKIGAYLKKNYGLRLEKEEDETKEKSRKMEIKKFAEKHYNNFALNYQHRVYVSDLEETLKLKHSIGAVIAVKNIQDIICFGTCFRIGEQFVITNCHVLKDIQDYGFTLDHVDFNYKESDGHSYRFEPDPLLVHSELLDYAILKLHLDDETFLPPNVTELGYSIPSTTFHLPPKECLTLIGHPDGMRKQIDVTCPLKREEIKKEFSFYLHKVSQNNLNSYEKAYFAAAFSTDSIPYDVSTFFESSSGSPGLLMSQKKLVVLHCRGVGLPPGMEKRFSVEEGIFMSCIVEDVRRQKQEGEVKLQNIELGHIFGPLQ